jgi:hypothetical protein
MISSADEFRRLRLASDADDYRRAASDEASDEVWIDVIDRYPDLREWVAHNKTVPLTILRRLAADSDKRVRYVVASKRTLDLPLFEMLACDPDEGVRDRIACNAKTPLSVRLRLAADSVGFVAENARARINVEQ